MHRRWMSLPLLASTVSAFYPYHETKPETPERGSLPTHGSSRRAQDDLVAVDIKKTFHKRANEFVISASNTPYAENALAIGQDGSDYSYLSTMKFGSKGQEMYMLIDTGSANTWIMGSTCISKSCTIHNLFGPDNSTTLNVTTSKWTLAYGTGTVSGVVANDTVKFANFTMNAGFGLATNASDDFNSYPMDGILGLGRATSNELGVPTIMETLKSQGKLVQNLLGIHLNRGADNTKDGELVFGGVNPSKFSGPITYTRTSNVAAWEVPVDDVFVNDAACGFIGRSAIIDTGTSYILMPPSDAKKLHSLIAGSVNSGETFTVPCDSKANIQVSFSGIKYSISPKDYIGRPTSSNTCSSNIVGHQAFGPNQWILGDVFLKNVYSVFDFDQGRIGFAMPGSGGTPTGAIAVSSPPASMATATSTMKPSGTSASGSSSASSTSSSANIGNPFDASKNSASVAYSNCNIFLLMIIAFFIGTIV